MISIVIPAKNRAGLIPETIESVQSQTFVDWELLVIDDGSTDDTASVVRQFAGNCSQRVRVLRHEVSRGAAAARNSGFAVAEGNYIALLDSDDRWFPEHLERLHAVATEKDAELVYSIAELFEDGTERSLGPFGPSFMELRNYPLSMFQRSYVVPSACMFKQSLLQRVGPWSTRHMYCEDYDWFLRATIAGCRFEHICAVTMRYRKSHNGATTEKLCATLEELAYTIANHAESGFLPRRVLDRCAIGRLIDAARSHRGSDPLLDPSASRRRGAELLIDAWRKRRGRIGCLIKGLQTWFQTLPATHRRRYEEVTPFIPTISGARCVSRRPPSKVDRSPASLLFDNHDVSASEAVLQDTGVHGDFREAA